MQNMTWFNINGSIGRGAYEEPEFPTAQSLVEHLDYLGIDRSLVWHVAARDMRPLEGNRRLLREIAEAGLEKRLLPAFIITPACFFEYGVMDYLREQFRSGQVRALRITPKMSRFPIREIETGAGRAGGIRAGAVLRFRPWRAGAGNPDLNTGPTFGWPCRHPENVGGFHSVLI